MTVLANHGLISGADKVTYIKTGSAVVIGTGTSMLIPYESDLPVNGVLIIQLAIGALTPQISADPSGWATIYNDTASSSIRQYIIRRFINGTESGDVTINFGSSISNVAIAQMHVFANQVHTPPISESGGLTVDDLNYTHSDITTTVPFSMAASFVYIPGNVTVGAYTGATGGTWVQRASASTTTGSDATIQLQTADMPVPGTISGGSYNAGVGGLSMNRSFGIIAE